MNKTSIEWCDFTANPIRYRDTEGKSVWACVKASEGCQHCYAEALAHRYQGREFTAKEMEGVTPYVDDRELKAMLSPAKLPAGSKVFVGDMTDMFGPWVPFDLLDRVFAVFALRPDVVFQVLTKRPERMREYLSEEPFGAAERVWGKWNNIVDHAFAPEWPGWPLPNVWLGVSAENQHWADVRIPELLATPAAVRFVSAEPLLAGWEIKWWLHTIKPYPRAINWVIVGGESGPGARPCDVGWIRSIVAQCQAAGAAVFVKQLGAKPYAALTEGDAFPPTGMTGTRYTLKHDDPAKAAIYPVLKSRKGGTPAEWPEDLRVREWPGGDA